jgi:hypothetical protein
MRRPRSIQLMVVSVIVPCAGVLAACGGTDDKKSTSEAKGFDSAYCVTARNWAAHELNGDGDVQYRRGGPTALRKYWTDYVAYTEASLQQAPPVIHEAAAIKARGIRRVTPLLEKYGFDLRRAATNASPSEQARAQPTPQEQKAQDILHAYDDRVCYYGGSPPAASVTFKPNAAAKPYCEAVVAQQQDLERVRAVDRVTPEALRAYSESDSFSKALDEQDATAPKEIAADVKAANEWTRTRGVDVMEEYDYDLRRLFREGSAEDLAVFTNWDPEIREQSSRVTAYQEQVCRIES